MRAPLIFGDQKKALVAAFFVLDYNIHYWRAVMRSYNRAQILLEDWRYGVLKTLAERV